MFASALALLQCDGHVWHSPHNCTVYRGNRVVPWGVAHESTFLGTVQFCACHDVYVPFVNGR